MMELEIGLNNLIECQALEIYQHGDELIIPYMMNDAVECYITFSDVTVKGEWDNDADDVTGVSLTTNGERNGLIFRRPGNVFTVWYSTYEKHTHLYQYHRIGHFWVQGFERWRRLVYLIGTLHDKYNFMGEDACNELELKLIPLMGYAPFRFFSPIKESLALYYENTAEGIEAISEIADKVGAGNYKQSIKTYKNAFESQKLNPGLIKRNALHMTRHTKILDYLETCIREASLPYEERVYEPKEEQQMQQMRQDCLQEYLAQGYCGDYPLLEKNGKKVIFYEEHPYVMHELEYEDFTFQIHPVEL
ncbi:MAG: DUF3878 family protein [Eubacterium sp.]|nr:DUF3878 family protein [Eubacterium sp.]